MPLQTHSLVGYSPCLPADRALPRLAAYICVSGPSNPAEQARDSQYAARSHVCAAVLDVECWLDSCWRRSFAEAWEDHRAERLVLDAWHVGTRIRALVTLPWSREQHYKKGQLDRRQHQCNQHRQTRNIFESSLASVLPDFETSHRSV